uniref:Uncharacterized protein n=1 Tax=Myoviridae sp. ctYA416 TaxID=2825125 RepID=A0A8S5UTL3_9CAUD|nr:MAG TPA: hypothetical protein [Myoviridae sp. ctYA416]
MFVAVIIFYNFHICTSSNEFGLLICKYLF